MPSQKESSSSNHPFSGSKMFVSGRVIQLPFSHSLVYETAWVPDINGGKPPKACRQKPGNHRCLIAPKGAHKATKEKSANIMQVHHSPFTSPMFMFKRSLHTKTISTHHWEPLSDSNQPTETTCAIFLGR